ncbi:MAG TPA: hypothetical protein VM733_08770 [Thermoanaerobaculia bacterium]|nr:hypothetical protein [Thermoanaerobaculia bacterium]
MRSSSIKTVAAVLTISAALIVVAPPAQARQQQPGTVTKRTESPADRAIRAVQRAMRRLIGGVTTNGDGPTVPLPRNNDTSSSAPANAPLTPSPFDWSWD